MEKSFTENQIQQSIATLEQEGTLLYPTDTIWGIGCDATSQKAIEKVYKLKARDHSKSMLILCKDLEMLSHYIQSPSPNALELLLNSSRPTTVIFPQAKNLPSNLLAADGSIGIRIPKMDFCQKLLQRFGKPIVSTSANFSGQPSPISFQAISPSLIALVDFCVEDSPQFQSTQQSSQILKLTPSGQIQTLRA